MAEPTIGEANQREALRAEAITTMSRMDDAHLFARLASAMAWCGGFLTLFMLLWLFVVQARFGVGCAACVIINAALFIAVGLVLALRVRIITSTRFDRASAAFLLDSLADQPWLDEQAGKVQPHRR